MLLWDSSSSESETETLESFFLQYALTFLEILNEVLHHGQYNWFTVVDFIKQAGDEFISGSILEIHFIHLYCSCQFSPKEQLTTSYAAFQASLPDPIQCQTASMLSGEVTDSESDNAEDYVGLTSITCEKAQTIIAKKRMSLARRV